MAVRQSVQSHRCKTVPPAAAAPTAGQPRPRHGRAYRTSRCPAHCTSTALRQPAYWRSGSHAPPPAALSNPDPLGSVAQLELDRLTHLWKCADRQPALLPFNTDQGTNQKTTTRKVIAVLIGSQPHQQVVTCTPLHLNGKLLQRLNQQVIGRAVRYSLDQIAAYLRNRPWLTDRLASLRNQRQYSVRAAYRQSHAALVEDIIIQENKR